jgi:hypothetical protein
MNNTDINKERESVDSLDGQVYGRTYPQQPQSQQYTPPYQAPFDVEPKKIFSILDKRIIIPFVMLLVLLIAGLVFFKIRASPEKEADVIAIQEIQQQEQKLSAEQPTDWLDKKADACVLLESGRDECLFDLATTFNKPIFCGSIKKTRGNFSADVCYETLAVKNYNTELCGFISPAYMGENSFYSCIFKTAKVTDDPQLCILLLDEEEIDGEELRYTKPLCISQFNMSMAEFKRIYEP